MEISHRFTVVRGIQTHALEAGEKHQPLVVLLHGGGVDSAGLSWETVIPALAGRFRVIAPDFPGYGESDKPALPYSVAFYEGFLTEFLNVMGIQRASLVGISMGGSVALSFTLRYPERVEKLVLVDSYGLQRSVPWHKLSYLFVKLPGVNESTWFFMRYPWMVRYSLSALLKRPGALTPALVEQAFHEANRPGAGKAWMTFQNEEVTWNGNRTCFIDRLGEIQAPTLIVHGSKDTLVPHDAVRLAHERIRGSALHWMEGCGHWPQRDHPEEFNRVLVEFLTSLTEGNP